MIYENKAVSHAEILEADAIECEKSHEASSQHAMQKGHFKEYMLIMLNAGGFMTLAIVLFMMVMLIVSS